MKFNNLYKLAIIFLTLLFMLNSCGIYRKVDAKEYPPEPEKRIQKNMEEGRGVRLFGGKKNRGGDFNFASSNELWRATLDIIDFMPLQSADYGGGIVITDWYNDTEVKNQSIKISIRFLSNEIRIDALDVKVFKKNCYANEDCKILKNQLKLENELKKVILKKAAIYAKERQKKNRKKYKVTGSDLEGTQGGNIFGSPTD